MSARTPSWRRNPAIAGAVGLALVVASVLAVMNLQRLPFVSGDSRTLSAAFVDAGGLEEGDRVEISGIEVGTVESLRIDGATVVVEFGVDPDVRLGRDTTASIRVGNLLGSKYLELVPGGSGELDGRIPVARTTPAYDVTDAFGELSETVDAIDTDQLEDALDAVAETFRGSSEDVDAALAGLSTISRTIADRDTEVTSLLDRTDDLSGTLDASRDDLSTVVRDAGLLLAEVEKRRDSLDGLIEHTRDLTVQLKGLVDDNEEQIGPALAELERVTDLLEDRQDDLAATLHAVARFARVFSNTIGSGPWFDSYLGNAPDSLTVGELP